MADTGQNLECALCGHRAAPESDSDAFRLLGAAPVTIVVCADLSGCVTRYADGRPSARAQAPATL